MFLLVPFGNFFLPCFTLAPAWLVWWVDIAVNKQLCPSPHRVGRISLLPEPKLCSQLLFSLCSSHAFLTLEQYVPNNMSHIYMDYNVYDTSHWLLSVEPAQLYHDSPGRGIFEFPNSIHSPMIRLH